MDDLIWQLLLQAVLIALNAVFACAEIAVLSIGGSKLEKMAENGNKKAVKLRKLTVQPAKFLATIQIAITLSGFLGSAFAADNFAGLLVDWAVGIGLKGNISALHSGAVVVITIILSYITLIFGELVPKRLAQKKPERVALALAGILNAISKAFAPLVWFLTVSVNAVLRLMGIDPNANNEEVDEEDIRLMVDAGEEQGTIDNAERNFIHNVFEFDDLCAGEIATHRKELVVLWQEQSDEEWMKIIKGTSHTAYPVCSQSIDNIVGILNAKAYLRLENTARANVMANAVKSTYFVPKSVRADVLLNNMKSRRERIAVVLDEYGGLVGVVTINDLLELLVGDFDDEPTEEELKPDIEPIDGSIWRIKGCAALEDVAESLGLDTLPLAEYDTFGGFVFGMLGYVPSDGAKVRFEKCGIRVKTDKIFEHRLQWATVCRTDCLCEDDGKAEENNG